MTAFRIVRPLSVTLAALLTAASFTLMLMAPDADARRLSGGRSFGKQSSTVNQQQAAPPARQAATAPASTPPAAAQPTGNRWMGPLTGLAAGLGIAALMSHLGLGEAMAQLLGNALLIGLAVTAGVFVWRMLRRSTPALAGARPLQPGFATAKPQTAHSGQMSVLGTPLPGSAAAPLITPSVSAADSPWGVPADFDTAGFLRVAKVQFIRMQAASDEKNLADIREFTTPEVFAEIKLQLDEDQAKGGKTDIMDLDAVLLGIETGSTEYLAGVRFSGSLREDGQNALAPFTEVWNLSKPVKGRGGWLLAGIQQVQ